MLAAKQDSSPHSANCRPLLRLGVARVALVLLGLLNFGPQTRAADRPQKDGLFISVANPITEEAVNRIRSKIEDAQQRKTHPLKEKSTIIFDFNPTNAPSGSPNFYVCLELSDFLIGLKNRYQTVAYIHNEVTRHTVLPVLACTEIVMSDNAEIGDVRLDQQGPLSPTAEFAYKKAATLRNELSRDLFLKMLDKSMGILKGKTNNGVTRYLGYHPHDKNNNMTRAIEKARTSKEGFTPADPPTWLEPGSARYKAEMVKDTPLCAKEKMNSRNQVVRAYGMSPASLREDLLHGQTLHPWLIEFSGSVTEARISSVRRKIDKAISKGGNFIILQLDCQTGTDTVAAVEFAGYLRNLKDDKNIYPVKTVAYIPPERSLGAATFIALGCNEIVMGKNSAFGDFEYLKGEEPESYEMKRKALVGLAEEQWYDRLLIQGTMDKDLVIFQVFSRAAHTDSFVSEEEFNKDQRSKIPQWEEKTVQIKGKGEFLKLDGERAEKFGLVRKLVDDVDGVYRHYGLKRDEVRRGSADLLDDIEMFFQNPLVRMLLVMIGIVGLILEMKMPGIGIPGVVAAVCFVLYFWANSSLGHFTWLAILLFVLGLILIGLEVFFLPGMAVFGISGIVLVVSSLVLVTLEKAPTTTRDWWELGGTLSGYTFVLIGGIVVAFLIARYLPQIPYANRLVLTPPAERVEPGQVDKLQAEAERSSALLGAIGEAATTLRPAGKARFGDQFLDVVAEGSYVNAGKRVQVIEIEGNRIVVKEV